MNYESSGEWEEGARGEGRSEGLVWSTGGEV